MLSRAEVHVVRETLPSPALLVTDVDRSDRGRDDEQFAMNSSDCPGETTGGEHRHVDESA